MSHPESPSPEARTYTAADPIVGAKLTCTRCGRAYAYPEPGGPAIRCECGWRYESDKVGAIQERFAPRIGV